MMAEPIFTQESNMSHAVKSIAYLIIATLWSSLALVFGQEKEAEVRSSNLDQAVTFKLERYLPSPSGSVVTIELSPNGKLLAAAGVKKEMVLYDTSNWEILGTSSGKIQAKDEGPFDTFSEVTPGTYLDMVFSEDSKYLVSVGYKKQVLIFEANKSLTVPVSYQLQFRPERVTLAGESQICVAGRSGSVQNLGITNSSKEKMQWIHKRFVGGLCSTHNNRVVYSAGGSDEFGYFLLRKFKTKQIVLQLPEKPARVSVGKSDEEILVTSTTKALVIDARKQKVTHQWDLPNAKKVEDIVYLPKHDLYATVSKAGLLEIWKKEFSKPIATHRVSEFDVYQVIPLGDDRLITCCRQAKNGISIWKIDVKPEQFPRTKSESGSNSIARPPTTTAAWKELNDEFEMSYISKDQIVLGQTSTGLTPEEYDWNVMELEASDKEVPSEFVRPETFQIWDAVVSKQGKMYLATSHGLFQKNGDKWNLILDENQKKLLAASLAQEPVDGIIIGQHGGLGVYELKDDGKLVSRGKLMDEDEAVKSLKKHTSIKTLSVDQVILSGSDYLAASPVGLFRYSGNWTKLSLQLNTEKNRFGLFERKIVCPKPGRKIAGVFVMEPGGSPIEIDVVKATDQKSSPLAKVHGLAMRKMVTTERGVFIAGIKKGSNPYKKSSSMVAGCCLFDGEKFRDLLVDQQVDWNEAKSDRGGRVPPKALIDFHPGFDLRRADLWFLTPQGIGLISGERNPENRFQGERILYFEKHFPLGIQFYRIRDLGNGDLMILPSTASRAQGVIQLRQIKKR